MIWITAGCTWSKLVAAPPPGAVVAGGAVVPGAAVVAAGAVVAVVPAGAVVSDVSSDPPLEPHAARSSEPVATRTQFRRDVMRETVDHEPPGCIGNTHTRAPFVTDVATERGHRRSGRDRHPSPRTAAPPPEVGTTVLRMRRLISSLVVAGTVLGTIAALPAASAQAAAVPSGFTDAEVASFSSPTAVEWLPNDQVVVLEKGGRIKVGPPAGPFVTAHTISNICTDSERGLLGLTPDPAFLGNGFVYVYYTRTAPARPVAASTASAASRWSASTIVPGSEVVLIDNISSNAGNHNGGDVDIGSDGFLYVAVGDAGRDPRGDSGSGGGNDAAQDLSLLNGKILRITLDGQPAPGNPISGPSTVACGSRGNTPSTPSTCVPGDLRLRPAQPVPVRVRPRRRFQPLLHQRRRPGHLRRGQPRPDRRQLRLADP